MNIKCDRCGKTYGDLFDTIHIDYVETGRDKPYDFHLCLGCRKELIKWIKVETWFDTTLGKQCSVT